MKKDKVTWHRNRSNVLVSTKCRTSSQNRTTFHFMCSLTSKLGNSKVWLITYKAAYFGGGFFKYIYLKEKAMVPVYSTHTVHICDKINTNAFFLLWFHVQPLNICTPIEIACPVSSNFFFFLLLLQYSYNKTIHLTKRHRFSQF